MKSGTSAKTAMQVTAGRIKKYFGKSIGHRNQKQVTMTNTLWETIRFQEVSYVREPYKTSPAFKQIYHGLAYRKTDVHIGLGVAIVVAVGSTALIKGMCVDRGNVAFEIRILS